ncbi:acyl-CoA N-acyltransferase [Phlebopus sp. FC_14]|nr:acyl-CoA N-acyltransferase [Phlebopus sp. FC_14]
MSEAFSFRPAVDEDLADLADILNNEIRTSTCTFRKSTVDIADRRAWLADLQLSGYPCFVIVQSPIEGGQRRTVGWCNLGRYRPAEAYDATTEVSLYVHQDFRGQGLGSRVLELVLAEARANGRRFRTLIAMVAMENRLNARFWERQGFTLLGVMKDVGNKFDRWLDVGLYQLLL